MNAIHHAKHRPGDSALAARLRRETEGEVKFAPADRGRYATDASIYQVEPIGVLVPRSIADVQAALAICREAGVPVQVGGGVRDLATAKAYIEAGVTRLIIGTIALEQPELFAEICAALPGRIGVSLDAVDGRLKVKGWVEDAGASVEDVVPRLARQGAAFVVYTDISRDGMLGGPNFEATAKLAAATSIPVVASGGVASLGDLIELQHIPGLLGAITGKALYEGRIELKQAIATIEKED